MFTILQWLITTQPQTNSITIILLYITHMLNNQNMLKVHTVPANTEYSSHCNLYQDF